MKTAEPRIGRAFAEWMEAQDHHKDHAAATVFRFSSVMGCSRQAGYKAANLPETDPMDGSSLAITGMGSLLHTDIQDAIKARWPHVTFEGTGALDDLISGHYDYDDPEADEIGEIKTVGAYKFDLSIGLFRSPGKGQPARMRPEGGKGPTISHICQAGFNANAHGRKNVRIMYLSREAVSVKKAEEAGLDTIGRIWAEWVFGPEVWAPLVATEVARLTKIRELVEVEKVLPDRSDFDDDGKVIKIDRSTHWRCLYCSQAKRCELDGPGRIPVLKSRAPA